jgi:predicted ATP-dependent endonuclease of OLD family
MIKKVFIQNYKIFEKFDLELNDTINIIVGDNEAGKSTILEAINLAFSKRLNGKLIEYELSPHIFNQNCVNSYLNELKDKKNPLLPKIIIEIYLEEKPELEYLRGSMNSKKEDAVGIKMEIIFDEDFREEYQSIVEHPEDVDLIPSEYYKVHWYTFSNNSITTRSLPVKISYIDATSIRLQNGTDYYLQDIIKTDLDPKERVGLSIAYRKLKEAFSKEDSIKAINSKLTERKGAVTEKDLSISMDISQKTNWETNLVPHLDSLPFHFSGKGEQSALKIMLALERKAKDSNLILIEEPENHLSFSSMNKLISKISEKCLDKQIIITTHSTYVLNKLGLENLILLNENKIAKLTLLNIDTQDYFKKLSGYDTLRLVLAKKAILVEGPSDELIIQKAYFDKNAKLPIDDGIDVINVRGLSFLRFLEIAKRLSKKISVVTDNDGDFKNNIGTKYSVYRDDTDIKICASDNDSLKTLEPHFLKVNGLALLNKIFGSSYSTDSDILNYMQNNKTDWALKVFETNESIKFPDYVNKAIE